MPRDRLTLRVPRWRSRTAWPCLEVAPDPLPVLCTRPKRHTGRHCATGSGGLVLAVWPERLEVSEPCS